ncbi:DUF6083 domain-containing protein [Streptomyces sp. NPDC097619]|uniref:DUF6083 domain-containing protein n=1 Tax=Streptomyces sp. NPDC097619 TaxID=3157228 RepID=UPI00332A975E
MSSEDFQPAAWDRSPGLHTLRINPHSPSRALRSDNTDRCAYCGHRVWWFDRADGGRIPLVPKEFPVRAVPVRARWAVDGGMARIGDMGRGTCWLAHPAVCPGMEHEDEDDPQLAGARRALAVRTRKLVESGAFVPRPRVPEEESGDLADSAPAALVPRPREAGPRERHVLSYSGILLLGPDTIDRIGCVSVAAGTGERCRNTVLDRTSNYQGDWQRVPVPVPPGRAGPTLWADAHMWVYALDGVDYTESVRWRNQRCVAHEAGTTPDAAQVEWVRFTPFRDADHILYGRPADADRAEADREYQRERIVCAGAGCVNGKEGTVDPDDLVEGVGWLCYQCRPRHLRRVRARGRSAGEHAARGPEAD